jgi:hypothetical protein
MAKSYSKTYRMLSNIWFGIASVLIILGFLAGLQNGYLPIGLAIVSLGLGSFSVGFGYDSNAKFTVNANKSFLEIVDIFEDKRIDLYRHNARGDPSLLIEACWKCRTYSNRAVALKEDFKIDKDNQMKLFQQMEQIVKFSSLPWNGVKIKITKGKNKGKFRTVKVMRDTEVNNILQICKNCAKLDLNNTEKKKLKEITDFVEKYV